MKWNTAVVPKLNSVSESKEGFVQMQIAALFPSYLYSPHFTPSSCLPLVSDSWVWDEAWKFAFLTSIQRMLLLLTRDTTLRTIRLVLLDIDWLNVALISFKGPLYFQKYLFLDKRVYSSFIYNIQYNFFIFINSVKCLFDFMPTSFGDSNILDS